jgi:hypothetical protein
MIDIEIPATAENGTLSLTDLDMEFPVKIGHLDPEAEESGWLGRLTNLGYVGSFRRRRSGSTSAALRY